MTFHINVVLLWMLMISVLFVMKALEEVGRGDVIHEIKFGVSGPILVARTSFNR